MRLLLVNANRVLPPIAPLALDYLAAVLHREGHQVDLLDLCFEPDVLLALRRQLAQADYQLVGLTLRNTDDCYYPGRQWFVPQWAKWVRQIRMLTPAPIVVGGVGFSVMPLPILKALGADGGVVGEGEFALSRLAAGDRRAPGIIWRDSNGSEWRVQQPQPEDLSRLPPMPRDFVDNARYLREGGQLGFETKRGCNAACIYCADPVAKGRKVRLRPPQAVAEELKRLADRDLVHLHTCDAEFNRPLDHALSVCEELIRAGLGGRLRWFAYCAPTPFPEDLARALRRAGCVGVNFGADSGGAGMLRALGRDYAPEDVKTAVERCRRNDLACMTDLLLGGPGETAESVRRTIEFFRLVSPDRVGLSVGLRVYPGTALARIAAREPSALHGPGATDGDFAKQAFYIAPALGEGIFSLVRSLVGNDRRFFFSDPTAADRNYNYDDNRVLVDAVARGYRGAYWDILRRLQEGLPPQ